MFEAKDFMELRKLLSLCLEYRGNGLRKFKIDTIEIEFDGPAAPEGFDVSQLSGFGEELAEEKAKDPNLCLLCQSRPLAATFPGYCRACGLAEAGVASG